MKPKSPERPTVPKPGKSQTTPKVLQTKSAQRQVPIVQLKSRPIGPPVYRPQIPKVLQPKSASQPSQAGQPPQRPIAPPVYRPQPTPRVLQTKKLDGPPRSATTAATRSIVAPPVYRPQPVPRVLQTKRTNGPQPKTYQPGRPAVSPRAIQRKVVFTIIDEDGVPKERKFTEHKDDVTELHAMVVRAYPRVAEIENVKPKIVSLIKDRVPRDSLSEVAQSLMARDVRYMAEPDMSTNLIIGESHSDPTAREYVKRLLPKLKAKGYKFLGYEFFGGDPIGNVFDPGHDINSDDPTTLQQAFDNALKNPTEGVLKKVEDEGGNFLWGHSTAALGSLFRAALAHGIRVVALDYDQKIPVKGKNRITRYDETAADILNGLGGKWIAISGGAHLPGIVAKTGATAIDLS